jgi:hypothetical protein
MARVQAQKVVRWLNSGENTTDWLYISVYFHIFLMYLPSYNKTTFYAVFGFWLHDVDPRIVLPQIEWIL